MRSLEVIQGKRKYEDTQPLHPGSAEAVMTLDSEDGANENENETKKQAAVLEIRNAFKCLLSASPTPRKHCSYSL